MSTELADVSKAVAEFDRVAAGLGALQEAYGGVVYEVATTKGMEEAKAARMAIREPRYEIERVRKEAKAPLLELGKKLDSEAKRITAELEKIEVPIHQQIVSEEDRKERERQEKIAAELRRVTLIHERIETLRGPPGLGATSGSATIEKAISALALKPVDESYEEFTQQAHDAKAAGLFRLGQALVAAQAHEAEQARIAAERAELAVLKAEQAARDAADRERRATEEREAKAIRAAEAAAQAEALRKDREAIDAASAQLARDQEALRVAQAAAAAPPPAPAKKKAKRPTSLEIVGVVAAHYNVTEKVACKWIVDLADEFAEGQKAG